MECGHLSQFDDTEELQVSKAGVWRVIGGMATKAL